MNFDSYEKKPQTNSDIIRSMTDAELACVIMCPKDIDGTGIYGCEFSNKNAEMCYKCSLKWLKQEAENG